jgi:hypothetical protein
MRAGNGETESAFPENRETLGHRPGSRLRLGSKADAKQVVRASLCFVRAEKLVQNQNSPKGLCARLEKVGQGFCVKEFWFAYFQSACP